MFLIPRNKVQWASPACGMRFGSGPQGSFAWPWKCQSGGINLCACTCVSLMNESLGFGGFRTLGVEQAHPTVPRLSTWLGIEAAPSTKASAASAEYTGGRCI